MNNQAAKVKRNVSDLLIDYKGLDYTPIPAMPPANSITGQEGESGEVEEEEEK